MLRGLGWWVVAAVLALPIQAEARSNIEMVGSSTVFPFTALVIERLATTRGVSVVNRSTGTGGGMAAFCAGLGDPFPDVTGASRPMTDAERGRCAANGVTDVVEIKIGSDGIVVASARRTPRVDLTRRQLFSALAGEVAGEGGVAANPARTWRDVDASLPDRPIVVLGPPTTSGTRDSFVELAMAAGCGGDASIAALAAERRKAVCTTIRDDGAYVDMGENDVEIVKRLAIEPNALGILGFSYAVRYAGDIAANPVEGVEPSEETIAAGTYSLSRPLFLYVKRAHLSVAPGLEAFLAEYTSERAMGPDGYLADAGLVALPDADRQRARTLVGGLAAEARR